MTIRTDKPEAEIGLYDDGRKIDYVKWLAHRELTKTIHKQVRRILSKSSIDLKNINGIVCFKGPGSFTGLRISSSIANALAYARGIPLVSTTGEKWIEGGIKRLQAGENERIVLPSYGHPPNISAPKK